MYVGHLNFASFLRGKHVSWDKGRLCKLPSGWWSVGGTCKRETCESETMIYIDNWVGKADGHFFKTLIYILKWVSEQEENKW